MLNKTVNRYKMPALQNYLTSRWSSTWTLEPTKFPRCSIVDIFRKLLSTFSEVYNSWKIWNLNQLSWPTDVIYPKTRSIQEHLVGVFKKLNHATILWQIETPFDKHEPGDVISRHKKDWRAYRWHFQKIISCYTFINYNSFNKI